MRMLCSVDEGERHSHYYVATTMTRRTKECKRRIATRAKPHHPSKRRAGRQHDFFVISRTGFARTRQTEAPQPPKHAQPHNTNRPHIQPITHAQHKSTFMPPSNTLHNSPNLACILKTQNPPAKTQITLSFHPRCYLSPPFPPLQPYLPDRGLAVVTRAASLRGSRPLHSLRRLVL